MTARTFTMIEVSGSPYDMGVQHGVQHRDLVLQSLETLERILAARSRPVSRHAAMAIAMESLPDAQEYAPELVEEVRGIADGAGVGFDEVFTLNASLDTLSTLTARDVADTQLNCSTYGVTAPATADGETYVGWNADDMEWWLPSCVLIRVRPTDGVPCLLWTFAGFVGRPGINPYLALAANGLRPTDNGRGVPYPFICRKALAQRTVADAIREMTSARRLSGMNYLLGDAEGTVASLEVTGQKHAVIGPRGGWVSHTNHYLDPELKAIECARPEKNTLKRQQRWQEMLREKEEKITTNDLQKMHGDHTHAPDSICCHGVGQWCGMTLTSLICAPRQGRMWVSHGQPCMNSFVEYVL